MYARVPPRQLSTPPEEQFVTATEPEVKLASVSHAALDAIASSICGTPFYDTEFVVPYQAKEESVFASSTIIKRACPALSRRTSRARTTNLRSDAEADTGARWDGELCDAEPWVDG